MQVTRKVFSIGHSKVVTLPAEWLKYNEKLIGHPITEVTMIINGCIQIEIPQDKEK
jgi:hypothetical protein